MAHLTRCEALLRSTDNLIEVHAKDNPELLKDLQKHRTEVENAARSGRWLDLANIALRIAVLSKFLFDHLPPPH